MAKPIVWAVDEDNTTIEVKYGDDGISISIKQGSDVIYLTHDGASPSSMIEGLLDAVTSTGFFDMPDMEKYGYELIDE